MAGVVAVVPARDEAAAIAAVILGMPAAVQRIVVVDDGSCDGTAAIARGTGDARVEVVVHPKARGVGAAIASGYLRARALDADVAVVLAGDGQMDARDLGPLVAAVVEGGADYAVGNRLAWPGGARRFPIDRLVGVVVLAAATRAATGLGVRDAQCGYTAISRRALAAIDWTKAWQGYGYPNDFLIRLVRAGMRVVDVPVRPIYGPLHRSRLRAWHVVPVVAMLARAALARARDRR